MADTQADMSSQRESSAAGISAASEIAQEQYLADCDGSTRGTHNPSVMDKPFWKYMVHQKWDAYSARKHFEPGKHLPGCEILESPPVWCFSRFGKTSTELPDGRVVHIAGEHEDSYDSDFCIYNDVIVIAPRSVPSQATDIVPQPATALDHITIYGYPVTAFLPTNQHTATYVSEAHTSNVENAQECIYIIGGQSYNRDRRLRQPECLVYRLDLADFSIQQQVTSGKGPAGNKTVRHQAVLVTGGIEVTLMEGKYLRETAGKSYLLELPGLDWRSGYQAPRNRLPDRAAHPASLDDNEEDPSDDDYDYDDHDNSHDDDPAYSDDGDGAKDFAACSAEDCGYCGHCTY